MTFIYLSSTKQVFSLLWDRAPVWRFALMSAAFLTLLGVLFPPITTSNRATQVPAIINEASYTPPKVAQELPARTPAEQAKTIDSPTSKSPTTKPSIQTTQTASNSAPLKVPVKPSPKDAELSLATPGDNAGSKDPSGLDAALMGRTYQDSILVAGFRLPLPPGNWIMLANSTIKMANDPANSGMSYFLGRIENKHLIGAVIVYAIRSPGSGFPGFNQCDMGNIYTEKEEIIPFDHQSCWNIHTYFTPPWQQWADKNININSIDRMAAGDMAAKGITYPQDLIAVKFFRSEKWALLDVSYLFNPENSGITSNVAPTFRDTDWYGANLEKYPAKIAYINKVKAWGASFWPRVKIAFAQGMPVVTPPVDNAGAPEPVAPK